MRPDEKIVFSCEKSTMISTGNEFGSRFSPRDETEPAPYSGRMKPALLRLPPRRNSMAETIVLDSCFSRRARPDGATDSICRHCFATVATAIWEADLDRAERWHACDPAQLERFEFERFQLRRFHREAARNRHGGEWSSARQASRA
jgi:hypothetical protein